MKTRKIIKLLFVVAAGIYMIYRSWDAIEDLAKNWETFFGFILLLGFLVFALNRVLRS